MLVATYLIIATNYLTEITLGRIYFGPGSKAPSVVALLHAQQDLVVFGTHSRGEPHTVRQTGNKAK